MRVFAEMFWHSEGWTPRNVALMEAVVKQARTTRHLWLVACDANMDPEDFKKSLWFIEAPGERISICRSKGPNGELIERTYDHLIASRSLQGKVKNMAVVEDFESRPHKAVTFQVENDTRLQWW